jgi:hypothetical protein
MAVIRGSNEFETFGVTEVSKYHKMSQCYIYYNFPKGIFLQIT